MSNAATYFRAMARNNAWANHRLLSACAKFSDAEFQAERVSFFPSIMQTLNHLLTVDWFYVDALEGGTLGPKAWADEAPCPTVATLMPEQHAVDRRLVAFCDALDDAGLARETHMHRVERVQADRTDRVLLHLFEHQIHHRGQAHAMLAGTSVPPPQLDEFFMTDEAPLRADEFKALGWTEADVWR
ncbi:MAG: DinB family protein [Dongia sp.]